MNFKLNSFFPLALLVSSALTPLNAQDIGATSNATAESMVSVVKAKGQGETPDKAERSALLRAIVQAVGALVDQETLVKNDEVIRDQILSVSSGFVKSFKVVSEPKKNLEGDFETVLEVVVEKRKLEKSLSDKGLVKAKSNTSDVWAETLSKTASADDAKRMLEAKLPTLIERLFNVSFFEENPKPVFLSKDSSKNTAKLLWWIKISSDRDFFYSQVAPMLDACLTAIIDDQKNDVSTERTVKQSVIIPKRRLPIDFRIPLDPHGKLGDSFGVYEMSYSEVPKFAKLIGFPSIDVELKVNNEIVKQSGISLLSELADISQVISGFGSPEWLFSPELGTAQVDPRLPRSRGIPETENRNQGTLEKLVASKPKTFPIGHMMFPSLLDTVSMGYSAYSSHHQFSDREKEGPEKVFYHAFSSKLFGNGRLRGPRMFFLPELVVESMTSGQTSKRETICSTVGRPGDVAFPIILDVPLSETNGTVELSVKIKRN